jgi:hypothetical protein
MSGLDILGGIGAGLMKGQQFVEQRDRNQATLSLLQDEAKRKQQDWQNKENERLRLAEIDRIYGEVYARDDLDDYGKAVEYGKLAGPRLTKAELELAMKTRQQAYNVLGKDAVNEWALTGKLDKSNRALDATRPGEKLVDENGMLMHYDANGQATPIIKKEHFYQILGISEAADAEEKKAREEEKRQLDMKNIQSQIGLREIQGQQISDTTNLNRARLELDQQKFEQELNNPHKNMPESVKTALWLANNATEEEKQAWLGTRSKENDEKIILDMAQKIAVSRYSDVTPEIIKEAQQMLALVRGQLNGAPGDDSASGGTDESSASSRKTAERFYDPATGRFINSGRVRTGRINSGN